MSEAIMKISPIDARTFAGVVRILTHQQAAAAWARRRYKGRDVVKSLEAEFGITNGKAKGVAYAYASQRTIDEITAHPKLGVQAEIEINAIRRGQSPEEYLQLNIEILRGNIADERRDNDEKDRRMVALAERLRAARDRGRPGAGV